MPLASNSSYLIGEQASELTMLSSLFTDNPLVSVWKVELTLTTVSASNGVSTGVSSFLVKLNQLPMGGSCSATPTNGTSGSTLFSISCINWVDPDGQIVKYSFFGKL